MNKLAITILLLISIHTHAFFSANLRDQLDTAQKTPKTRIEIASNDRLRVEVSAAEVPTAPKETSKTPKRWWHLWIYEPRSNEHFAVVHFTLEENNVSLIGMWLDEKKRGQNLSYLGIGLLYQLSSELGYNFRTEPIKKPILIRVLHNLYLTPQHDSFPFFICTGGEKLGVFSNFDFPKGFEISQGITLLASLPPNFENDCKIYYGLTSYNLDPNTLTDFLTKLREKNALFE